MNNKGMSLMEMIIAIMILSIASLMIFTGFSTVLNFMSKANDIKQQSNAMFAYAEKTDDGTLRSSIAKSDTPMTYSITNSDGVSVMASGVSSQLKVKGKGDILLKTFDNDMLELGMNTPDYLDVSGFANELIEVSDRYEKGLDQVFSYTDIIKKMLLGEFASNNQLFREFHKSLLPQKDHKFLADTYYVRIYYPWEYNVPKTGSAFYEMYHGGKLIYVSENGGSIDDLKAKETIHIIYEPENKKWYYTDKDNVTVYNKNPFGLLEEANIAVDGSTKKIMNWKEMKAYIEKPENGWKMFDENAQFDSGNPDASWK